MPLVKIKSLIPCHAPLKKWVNSEFQKGIFINIIIQYHLYHIDHEKTLWALWKTTWKRELPLATHFTSRFLSQYPARLKSHWFQWIQITPKPTHLRMEVGSQRHHYIYIYIYISILSFHFVYSNSLIKLTFTKDFIGK